jgi:histidine triad (HIT) family protein
MSDCIFCKIVSGEMPSYKVYEDDAILAFMDIYPISEGHLLIIPKKHYKDLLSMDPKISERIIEVAQNIGNKVISKLGADGFNFATNQGEAAEQDVFHVHFHIIPRRFGDKLVSWKNHDATKEELQAIADKLKQ